MAKNADGELEVLVGNKQLLSILFVLMVMFGIVFTMGYFVGRNSASEIAAAPNRPSPADTSTEGRPDPAGTPAAAPPAANDASAQPAATTPASGDQAAAPATETAPVGGSPQPAPAPATRPEAPPPAPAAPSGPQPGQTYIQVTAANKTAAEIFVEALKKKGLPALVGDSVSRNGENLYRVLVGPYDDAASLARARSDLETLLKQKVFVRKY
jgi:cell division septation protein DedD